MSVFRTAMWPFPYQTVVYTREQWFPFLLGQTAFLYCVRKRPTNRHRTFL